MVQNTCHMQSCWLMTSLSCNNSTFTPLLARAYIFVVLQEATTLIFFFCPIMRTWATSIAMTTTILFLWRIAMSKQWWYNFYIKSQGSKWWLRGIAREQASVHRIARANKDNIWPSQGCKVQLRWYGNDGPPCNNQIFICCQMQEAMTLSISLMLYREMSDNIFLMLQEAVIFSGSVQHNLTIARREDATIKHFVRCWSQGWWQWAYLGTSHCKKQRQRWLIATKKREMAPRNNQQYISVASQGGKQWLQRHKVPAIKYIVRMTTLLTWLLILYFTRCIAKSFDNDKILFSQVQQATTKVDCNNRVRKIA